MINNLNRRKFLTGSSAALLAAEAISRPATAAANQAPSQRSDQPNILIISVDDMGYGDLSCYGSPLIHTPRLDQLARQGTRFTNGYAGHPTCTPSRAACLTGRLPARMGQHMMSALPQGSDQGLPEDEVTIADYLRQAGYYTAGIGKWHLGVLPWFQPHNFGFDSYFGLDATYTRNTYPMDLWRDGATVETIDDDAELALMTGRFTDEAIDVIDRADGRPFFIYLSETTPHLPIVVEPDFDGASPGGRYGDMIQALDHHLGRLLDAISDRGLDESTLVIFASDNGPWFEGSTGGLRGRKFDCWEGGMRVPFIARWPKYVPADRVSDATVSVLDLLPTLCGIAGAEVDPSIPLDGNDIRPVLRGGQLGSRSPVYYYLNGDVRAAAVRDGQWKLHVRRRGSDQRFLPELYDLGRDPQESSSLASRNPEVVARLQQLIAEHDAQVARDRDGGVLRLTGFDAGTPLFAGEETSVQVTVEYNDPDAADPIDVTATVDAPAGWSAGEASRTVAPGSTVTIEVPITPPSGPPTAGVLDFLAAQAVSDGIRASGVARVHALVVPRGEDAVLALDGGTAGSPVVPGYQPLTPQTAWDAAAGYGWVEDPPESRDRGAPDDMRRDMVTWTDPAVLRLTIPAGRHLVSLLRGDNGFQTVGFVVAADGDEVVPAGPTMTVANYSWERFVLDGGADGRDVDLRFSLPGETPGNVWWKVTALLVQAA